MSVGTMNGGAVTVGDYQDASGKIIYSNKGPQCAKCGRPYRQCVCEPVIDVPGENTALQSPSNRQAASLELIAFHASKLVKLIEKLLERLGEPTMIATPVGAQVEIMPVGIAIPGVTDSPVPVLDPAKIAENEAKKAATMERMKGAK